MRHSPKGKISPEELKRKVAESANFQGNHSNLMLERLSHPRKFEELTRLFLTREKWKEKHGVRVRVKDEHGNTQTDERGHPVYKYLPYRPKSKEVIERYLKRKIELLKASTRVNYAGVAMGGHRENIPLGRKFYDIPMSMMQMSIMEAHEKYHALLVPLGQGFLDEYFASTFDFSKVSLTPIHAELISNGFSRRAQSADIPEAHPRDEILDEEGIEEGDLIEDFPEEAMDIAHMLNGHELIVRMTQLKNYFGMKGNDEFTSEHLRYAKEHYVEDVAGDNPVADNLMTEFLQAITPRTEKEFLRLINTSGV